MQCIVICSPLFLSPDIAFSTVFSICWSCCRWVQVFFRGWCQWCLYWKRGADTAKAYHFTVMYIIVFILTIFTIIWFFPIAVLAYKWQAENRGQNNKFLKDFKWTSADIDSLCLKEYDEVNYFRLVWRYLRWFDWKIIYQKKYCLSSWHMHYY